MATTEGLLAPSESEHHDLGLSNWEQVSKGEEGEFTAAIKDKLVNASGCPVLHLQQVRGQPKDGAILMTDKGYRVKCAVKLIGLPEAGLSWKGVGTRHEAIPTSKISKIAISKIIKIAINHLDQQTSSNQKNINRQNQSSSATCQQVNNHKSSYCKLWGGSEATVMNQSICFLEASKV